MGVANNDDFDLRLVGVVTTRAGIDVESIVNTMEEHGFRLRQIYVERGPPLSVRLG